MFTIEQLKQLSDFLIEEFKEVFVTKEDLKQYGNKFDQLQTSVDGFMKVTKKNEEEILVMGHRLSEVENKVN